MASLLSSWSSNLESLPEDYVVPEEIRPRNPVRIGKEIPVIDLGDDAHPNRADLIQQIMKAGEEFGLFQVINHGVSERLMVDAMEVGKDFFGLSSEEKERFSEESAKFGEKGCSLFTGNGGYSKQDFKYWRDNLQHLFYPIEDHINFWPEKPTRYREIIGVYASEVRKLSMSIMDMIYEGLKLDEVENIEKEFENYSLFFSINHYPACPDPTSALGTKGHHDPNLMSLVQQDLSGLHLLKDTQWIGVEPIPNAFVINIGLSLEIISNGKLRAGLHRVVTNSDCSRTALVTFVNCSSDAIVQPAKSPLNDANPPLYRAVKYKDFLEAFLSFNSEYEPALEYLEPKI